MEFTVRLFEPLQGANDTPRALAEDLLIDPHRTSVRIDTQTPGGFGGCAVNVPSRGSHLWPGYLPRRVAELRYFAHVEVYAAANADPVFEGRVMRIRYGPGGDPVGFTANGYWSALRDRTFTSADSTASTSGAVLRQVIAQMDAPLTIGNSDQYVDPGVPYTLAELDGLKLSQIFDLFGKGGGVDGRMYDLTIRANRTVYWLPRKRPQTPDYHIPWDDSLDVEGSSEELWEDVTVRYDAGAGDVTTATASNTTFFDEWNVHRDITLEGGKLSADAAETYRDVYLGEHADPAYAVSIWREDGRGMETPGGVDLPSYLVQQGQWVEITGLPMQLITKTVYTSDNRNLSVQAGTLESAAQQYQNLIKDRKARLNRINGITGGRDR